MSEVIATTSGGNKIELYKLGASGKPIMLLVGGVHGDEPEGVWLVEAFLKSAPTEASKWNCQIWVIPNLNPDGRSKNTRTNGRGVDLNRNFPAPDWTKEAKAERYFPGEAPGSEVETQALIKVFEQAKPFLLVHCHSWLPQINYTGAPAKPWADILSKQTGYPATEDIGYPTPGSIGQYGWYQKKTPVICIEMQERDTKENVVDRGLQALLDLAHYGVGYERDDRSK